MQVTLLIFGAIVLAGLIIYWIFQPSNRKRRSSPRRANRPPKRVVSLLNGDTATAQRLFETARLRNPAESDQWCWEKVLWDIERDRRW